MGLLGSGLPMRAALSSGIFFEEKNCLCSNGLCRSYTQTTAQLSSLAKSTVVAVQKAGKSAHHCLCFFSGMRIGEEICRHCRVFCAHLKLSWSICSLTFPEASLVVLAGAFHIRDLRYAGWLQDSQQVAQLLQ